VNPVLGVKELRNIRPSGIQAWIRSMSKLSLSYQRTIFSNVSTIMAAAVDDEIIAKSPCSAASVRKPRPEQRHVIPWEARQVKAVRDALPERYRIVAVLAAGLGVRQGEVFGLSPDDVDFLRGKVQVRRQVKLYANGQQAFALPKGRKTRTVPLPASVRDELAAYLAKYPARNVTLPWGDLGAPEITVALIVTSRESKAVNRNYFNSKIWKKALVKVGIAPTRDNGCHALRHFYGSVLIDGGESIRAVSEYLGHSDPGFTLKTSVHVMRASEDRSKKAIDDMWADDDSDARSSALEASE
jgi:integrase